MLVVGTMMCTGCSGGDNSSEVNKEDIKINYKYQTTKEVFGSEKSIITVNGTAVSGNATVKCIPYGNRYSSGYIGSNLAKYSISSSTITITFNNVSFGKCAVTGEISNNGEIVTYTDAQSRKWTYERV